MRISEDLRYDADPATVRAMLLDPAFREDVTKAQKVVRSAIEVTSEADTTVVTVEQTQSTSGVPSFVRKLTGDEITITQVERWTSDTHAEVTSTIPGAPGQVFGTNDLVADGDGTVVRVVREVTVRIPLVGSKLASFVAQMHTKALAKEHAAGQAWLEAR